MVGTRRKVGRGLRDRGRPASTPVEAVGHVDIEEARALLVEEALDRSDEAWIERAMRTHHVRLSSPGHRGGKR